jgi:hypothetical protein
VVHFTPLKVFDKDTKITDMVYKIVPKTIEIKSVDVWTLVSDIALFKDELANKLKSIRNLRYVLPPNDEFFLVDRCYIPVKDEQYILEGPQSFAAQKNCLYKWNIDLVYCKCNSVTV